MLGANLPFCGGAFRRGGGSVARSRPIASCAAAVAVSTRLRSARVSPTHDEPELIVSDSDYIIAFIGITHD